MCCLDEETEYTELSPTSQQTPTAAAAAAAAAQRDVESRQAAVRSASDTKLSAAADERGM